MPKRPDRSASSLFIPSASMDPFLPTPDSNRIRWKRFLRSREIATRESRFFYRETFLRLFLLLVDRVDFTGIFMVDGCCVARWHLGKAKGKCQK